MNNNNNNTMNNFKNIFIFLIIIANICLGILTLFFDFSLANWIKIIISAGLILAGIFMIFLFFFKKQSWLKICIVCSIFAYLIIIAYLIILTNDWLKYFSSADAIKDLILSTGNWGKFVFLIIQFMQVVFIPIPAIITTLAGTSIYGPLEASILSFIGIMVGSLVAFLLGRILGRKVVSWIAGKEQTEKYAKMLNHRGKFLLIIMLLFPVFPDDILCLIAGITTMSLRFFAFAILITRPLTIIVTCYLGSGQLIPYSGWGLFVWPILIILLIAIFIFTWKYQDKIEKYFINKFNIQSKGTERKSQNTDLKLINKSNISNDNIKNEKQVNENNINIDKIKNEKNIEKSNINDDNIKNKKLINKNCINIDKIKIEKNLDNNKLNMKTKSKKNKF